MGFDPSLGLRRRGSCICMVWDGGGMVDDELIGSSVKE